MKKLIFATVLFLGFAVSGFSQERPAREKKSPEERAQLVADALAQKLSLNDKQKKEIYQINLERAKEMERMRADADKRDKKDFAKRKEMHQANENKINNILTAEQKKLYAELKEKREAKMKDHAKRKGHRPGFKKEDKKSK